MEVLQLLKGQVAEGQFLDERKFLKKDNLLDELEDFSENEKIYALLLVLSIKKENSDS